MTRKITQKRRLNKNKQRGRKTRGGAGASDYMIQVAGDMNNQHGANGLLKYTPVQSGGSNNVANQAAGLANALNNQSGGVGAPMAVPVVLMLANQFVPKMLRGQRGGVNNHLITSSSPSVNTVNHIDPLQSEEEEDIFGNNPRPTARPTALNEITEGTQKTEQTGSGMLGTIAVPAALVLASNYFGKRSRRRERKPKYLSRKHIGGSDNSVIVDKLDKDIGRIDEELKVRPTNDVNRIPPLLKLRRLLNTVRAALTILPDDNTVEKPQFEGLADEIYTKFTEVNREGFVLQQTLTTMMTNSTIFGLLYKANNILITLRTNNPTLYDNYVETARSLYPGTNNPMTDSMVDPQNDQNIQAGYIERYNPDNEEV